MGEAGSAAGPSMPWYWSDEVKKGKDKGTTGKAVGKGTKGKKGARAATFGTQGPLPFEVPAALQRFREEQMAQALSSAPWKRPAACVIRKRPAAPLVQKREKASASKTGEHIERWRAKLIKSTTGRRPTRRELIERAGRLGAKEGPQMWRGVDETSEESQGEELKEQKQSRRVAPTTPPRRRGAKQPQQQQKEETRRVPPSNCAWQCTPQERHCQLLAAPAPRSPRRSSRPPSTIRHSESQESCRMEIADDEVGDEESSDAD